MKKVIYNNTEFRSLYKACKDLGLNYSAVSARVQRGYTAEESIEHFLKGLNNIKVEYKGNKYSSTFFLCKSLGVPYSSIRLRMDRGFSLEESVDYILQFRSRTKNIEYKGVIYKDISTLAKDLGINIDSLRSLMNYKGLGLKDSINRLLELKRSQNR